MKTVLLVGVLAACLAICCARYKTSDFTDAGKNYRYVVSHHAAICSIKVHYATLISYCLPYFVYLQREWKQPYRE